MAEIVYCGLRYNVNWDLSLRSSEGKHYCNSSHCTWCEESTEHNDAHYFDTDFPCRDFVDDLGNAWAYVGDIAHDESPSYGWYETTHRWTLKRGGRKDGGFRPADDLNVAKVRRRIEDRLRKSPEHEIIALAIRMGISLA